MEALNSITDRFKKWQLVAVICAIAFWIGAFVVLRSFAAVGAVVDMRLDTDHPGVAKWYFNRGPGFTEADSVAVRIRPGSNDVRFRLPSGTYTAFRFDPIDSDAQVVVRIMHWHVASDTAAFPAELNNLTPLANMARLSPSPDGAGVVAVPSPGADDPQVQLPLTQPLRLGPMRSAATDAAAAALIAAFLLGLVWFVRRTPTRILIAAGLFLVAGLIVGLACMSRTGVAHPDERAHGWVFEYLTEHVLPPAADDPDARWTLSTFGYSYLFELNVTYWVAARVMAPLAGLFPTPEHAARVFQCMLWLVLACLALRRRRETIALGILFLSPQIWYVFAYFNGDAFPLLIAFVAVLLSAPSAGVHEFIEGRARLRSAAGFALCIGLLMVSKANYLPLVPGFLLWLAVLHIDLRWRELVAALAAFALLGAYVFAAPSPAFVSTHLPATLGIGGVGLLTAAVVSASYRCWRDVALRSRFLRLVGVLVFALAFAAPRIAQDVYVNGLPSTKATRVEAMEEAYARADLRPSVIARGQGGEGTGLVMQHIGLKDMLFGARYFWIGNSTTTALGLYGYVNILAPFWMYYALLSIALGCVALSAFGLCRAVPMHYARLLSVAAGASFLVVESSALHSWIEAFQPQGRYLFPIFALLALVVVYAESKLPRTAFKLLLASALLVSVASFAFVALPAFGVNN